MNYSELIERLSDQTGKSKKETKELLSDAISVLSDQLSSGTGVSIPDLGTFQTKVNEEKKVYNPHYDAYMIVPPKRVVNFSPASGLKEEVKFLSTDED
ncbi:HU family DNA-binding protein [Rhodohalobacter sulfatireducens]|uniref:HU family DNA-binding protein n=1 Tax=Rhodohalobacter sulfatireducens TaxID=2911366 RepID=A0ABS9KBP8_9BACT|nr:HU family DNA-binding protein [Rhodohalobacter sulfatireducens]MCG2588262.1 HU family DNA-binding protein [Rhodohalobacter sulfatireducens]